MKSKNTTVSQTAARRKVPRNGKLDKALKISQIYELYHDEWIAVHLTKVDRYDNPMAGVLVAHAKTDTELLRQAKDYRFKNPEAKVYIFFAGNVIPEGVTVVLEISQ